NGSRKSKNLHFFPENSTPHANCPIGGGGWQNDKNPRCPRFFGSPPIPRCGGEVYALMLTFLLIIGAILRPALGSEQEQVPVGVQPDGRIVVPTNQILQPAGTQVTFPGRPVDLALTEDGKLLVVKNAKDIVLIDPVKAQVQQTVSIPRK